MLSPTLTCDSSTPARNFPSYGAGHIPHSSGLFNTHCNTANRSRDYGETKALHRLTFFSRDRWSALAHHPQHKKARTCTRISVYLLIYAVHRSVCKSLKSVKAIQVQQWVYPQLEVIFLRSINGCPAGSPTDWDSRTPFWKIQLEIIHNSIYI